MIFQAVPGRGLAGGHTLTEMQEVAGQAGQGGAEEGHSRVSGTMTGMGMGVEMRG